MSVTRLRTFQQVLDFLNGFFDANTANLVPPVARIEGSIPQDFIDLDANEGKNIYTVLTFTFNAQTVPGLQDLIATDADSTLFRQEMEVAFDKTSEEVDVLISSAVDRKAQDNGLTRIAASAATLTLRFYTTSNANVSIPLSTTAQTQSVTPIQYATSVNIVNEPVTLDPTNGLYYIDVPAEAVIAGSSSNVPLNAVNQIAPPLAGFNTVKNITASTGGVDEETNAALLQRILLVIKGTQLDTIYGLQNLISSQVGVVSAFVVDNSNSLMTRGVGNQVDIWFLGNIMETKTDTIIWDSTTLGTEYVMMTQPVKEVISVKVNSVLQVEGVDYDVDLDDGGYSHSIRALDKITWIIPPVDGDTVDIEYTHNGLVTTLQELLAQPENQIPNSDILVKEAIELPIDLEMLVVFLPSYSSTDVKAQITANLEAFFGALTLGQNVFESTVAQIVQSTPGVDHVEIPFTKMAINPATGTSDISVQQNQYARLNSLVFD